MYYLIYETKNIINQKIYVGYHATENLEDDYLGSGVAILRAIKKYGKENFKKTILFIFPSEIEALLKEAEIVDYDFIMREDTYNFKLGGEGGWSHIPRLIKEDKDFRKKMYSKISESLKKAYKDGKILGWKSYTAENGFKGKTHSKETKIKISMNNGRKLSIEDEQNRIIDFLNEIEKNKAGVISNLAKKWKISHTSVRRFLEGRIKGKTIKYFFDIAIQNKNKRYRIIEEKQIPEEGIIIDYNFYNNHILEIKYVNNYGEGVLLLQ